MNGAIVMQVIRTTLLRRGEGKPPDDPVRVITQYWSLDGELLAEVDPATRRGRGFVTAANQEET